LTIYGTLRRVVAARVGVFMMYILVKSMACKNRLALRKKNGMGIRIGMNRVLD
jgi:hypothetical protein